VWVVAREAVVASMHVWCCTTAARVIDASSTIDVPQDLTIDRCDRVDRVWREPVMSALSGTLCARLRSSVPLACGFLVYLSAIRGTYIDRVRYTLNWKTRRHQFISIHLRTGTVAPERE
jgi:hypothetical protein